MRVTTAIGLLLVASRNRSKYARTTCHSIDHPMCDHVMKRLTLLSSPPLSRGKWLLTIAAGFLALFTCTNLCLAQAKNLKDAISRADSLLAGYQNGVPPYHLHYDLTETSMTGQITTGTYDSWFVDPTHNRNRLVMGSYFWDATMDGASLVRHTSGQRSLRLQEFYWLWSRPKLVIDDLSDQKSIPGLKKINTSLGPELCASTTYSELCFDGNRGNYVRASAGNLTAVYAQWRPIGLRFFPTDVALFHKKVMIFHAIGSVEPFQDTSGILDVTKQTYPSPDDPIRPYPKLLHSSVSKSDSYGYALVKIWVDNQGNVAKFLLLDADEKSIADAALRTVQTFKYVPAQLAGQPTASETTYLYSTWGGN